MILNMVGLMKIIMYTAMTELLCILRKLFSLIWRRGGFFNYTFIST